MKNTLLTFLLTLTIWSVNAQTYHKGDKFCNFTEITIQGQETKHFCSAFPNGILASENKVHQYQKLKGQGWELVMEQTAYGWNSYYRCYVEKNGYVRQERRHIVRDGEVRMNIRSARY